MTGTHIQSSTQLSNRLVKLLHHAKQDHPLGGWRGIAMAMGEIYHPDMTLVDAVHHAIAGLEEAMAESRFELGDKRNLTEDLVLSPIKGYCSMEVLGRPNLETRYSVEQFYDAVSNTVIGRLRIARVDWCNQYKQFALSQQPDLLPTTEK